ncbi:MAG: MFS transporter [Burkholderiales bacterium]|nr:MFS transporter [Burkholderiales bacterium]
MYFYYVNPNCCYWVLPTYNDIGIISTIILILLRIIHGFGAGGELPVNATYIISQSLKPHQKTILCSLLNCSAIFGILLASLTTFILHKWFSKTEIINWAWRIPFLISIPIFFAIYLIRKYIPKQNIAILHNAFKTNTHPYNVTSILKIILFIAFIQVTFYIMFMWLPSYLPTFINITAYYTQYINTISLLVLIFFTILFGVICSKLKPFFIIKIGIILTIFSTILFFTCVTSNNAFIYLILFSTSFALVQASFLPILANMCYGNYSETKLILSFSLGTALFGSTAPLFCTYFLHKFNLSFFPSMYISVLGILSLFIIENKTSH